MRVCVLVLLGYFSKAAEEEEYEEHAIKSVFELMRRRSSWWGDEGLTKKEDA